MDVNRDIINPIKANTAAPIRRDPPIKPMLLDKPAPTNDRTTPMIPIS